MKQSIIYEAIDRINHMEQCFDVLQKAADTNPDALMKDTSLKNLLRTLIQYYEGEQWLQDYALDEKGLLPENLKRGILSQDSVYDFLEQIKHID